MALDYSSEVGKVRLLIADTDEANLLLDDAQITAFLAMNASVLKLAAADALDAIASSEALVSKKIRTQDLSTDGPATAAALRTHADKLRAQADSETDDGGVFDIIYPTTTTYAELTEYDYWGTV